MRVSAELQRQLDSTNITYRYLRRVEFAERDTSIGGAVDRALVTEVRFNSGT